MGQYFSLPLAGAGTYRVENFRHYLSRLADIHGVSVWQLVRHMQGWWASTHDYLPLPKYLLSQALFGVCAHGRDVANLVTIVEIATGVTDLRAATIQPLREVLPTNANYIFKANRAWCPTCFIEQMKSHGFLYEPLLWALRHIKRCPEHQLRLIDRCPTCSRAQGVYSATLDLTRCAYCGNSLIPKSGPRKQHLEPLLGEKDLIELLAAWADNPSITFSRKAYPRFIAEFERKWLDVHYDGIDVEAAKSICHSSHYSQPQLRTLLNMAALAGVSARLILEDPIAASSVSMLPIQWPLKIPRAVRPQYSREYQFRLMDYLNNLILSHKAGTPFPSLHELLSNSEVSSLTVKRWFPRIVREIRRRHVLFKRTMASQQRVAMMQVLKDSGLLRDYISGHIRSQDSVVNILVERTGARTSYARRVLSELLKSDSTDTSAPG